MDETSGGTAREFLNRGDAVWKNGTETNLAWVTGAVDQPNQPSVTGNAADLGGQDSSLNYFEVNLAGRLINASALSLSLWFQSDNVTGNFYKGLFMTRSTLTGDAAGNMNWGLAVERSAAVNFLHIDSRNASSAIDSAEILDPSNMWHHVVLVWDGAGEGEAGTHTQYLDGVKLVSPTAAPIGLISGGVWHIGNDNTGTNRRFNGRIDDVAAWDNALTDADVAALFARTAAPHTLYPPADSDGDGMPDNYENQYPGILNPTVADANADSDTVDGLAGSAAAPDGLTNLQEFLLATNPANPDSDGDGLTDGAEVNTHLTSPLKPDTDGDTIPDAEEVVAGVDTFITNPNRIDTDNDGLRDDSEIAGGFNPTDANSPPVTPPPSAGMVALYKFDETSGTTALDSAQAEGAQNAEQNQGTAGWTATGKIGGALDLPGATNPTSLLANDALPAGTQAFTMSSWVFPRSNGGYFGVYATRVIGGSPNYNWGINLELNPLAGDLRFATGTSAGGSSAGLDTPPLPLDAWSHVAMTWSSDGVTAVGKGYVNGSFIGQITQGLNPTYASVGTYNIGDDPVANGREFNGMIDDLAVWNTALTDIEIRNIYALGQTGVGVTPPATPPAFVISDITRNANGTVNLTWTSDPFEAGTPDELKSSYTVHYSSDLTLPLAQWSKDATSVISQGTQSTHTTTANFPGMGRMFFVIEKNR